MIAVWRHPFFFRRFHRRAFGANCDSSPSTMIARSLLFLIVLLFPCADLQADRPLLGRYDLRRPDAKLKLPAELAEISGITFDAAGRLFAHDDERGTVYELDPRSGKIVKRFSIYERRWFGNYPVAADFEDIAFAGGRFYMVTSSGVVYAFSEGEDNALVEAVRHETFLNDLYDVEGLCHDPVTNSLLLACKENPGAISLRKLLFERKKAAVAFKPVFSFSLETLSLRKEPRFLLDAEALRKVGNGKTFKPSAIERHPVSGDFFVLSAHSRSLVEVDGTGKVRFAVKLGRKDHPQAEGLAFGPRLDMFISNEGAKKTPRLFRYMPETQPLSGSSDR